MRKISRVVKWLKYKVCSCSLMFSENTPRVDFVVASSLKFNAIHIHVSLFNFRLKTDKNC